jgi:hypothetical protein
MMGSDFMPDINVLIIDNPFGVKGSVHKNRDGSYTILIDAHLNYEQQLEVYKHELFHILNEDFNKEDIQSIEFYAHG